jgi:hypothetical protein
MAQPTVTGRCHRVQGEVHAADQQVGAHQHQRPIQTAWPVLPGLGNGQVDDKDGRHGHGHARPHEALIGPCLVPQPGVGRPGPPQQREQQQPLEHAMGAVLVGHVAGDLGGGKHIDQVEEQLEGRHPMVLTGGANAAQDPAASLHLVLLNHGQHSSPRSASSRGPPGEADHADPHAGGLLALTVRDLLAALKTRPWDAELLAFQAD